jgi:hypothetical protein
MSDTNGSRRVPTNVVNFGGVYYATAYHLYGGRIVVQGTHQSDLDGVRMWLTAHGYPRGGAYLSPAAGTAPGYYVKPYVADAYYRIDPATRTAAWDGTTQFGESAPVTEGDGFRE